MTRVFCFIYFISSINKKAHNLCGPCAFLFILSVIGLYVDVIRIWSDVPLHQLLYLPITLCIIFSDAPERLIT